MQCDRFWTGARLVTMVEGKPGLGIAEPGLIAARDGRIAYAGPAAAAPACSAPDVMHQRVWQGH